MQRGRQAKAAHTAPQLSQKVGRNRWFRDHVREVHGVNVEDCFPPPKQIMDFRAA